MVLLTSDGLLYLISVGEEEGEKLLKCVDLMMEKAVSMGLYKDKVMCGGHNSLVKVIDLNTISLVNRLPKPPPVNRENVAKDSSESEGYYDENEEFPQCVGVKTIGSYFSQFIITLYDNKTLFVWRPEPEMIAMRSIISHRASISSVKVLDEINNEITFFGTLSQDSTRTPPLR